MKLLAVVVAIAAMVLAGPARAAADWNGTWAGNWQGGDGIQLIMAGNDAIGIYLHGDYLSDELHAKVSADGKTLTISWAHGNALLTRDSAEVAHITIREPGKPAETFAVKRDH
jgi:hypothetical protein